MKRIFKSFLIPKSLFVIALAIAGVRILTNNFGIAESYNPLLGQIGLILQIIICAMIFPAIIFFLMAIILRKNVGPWLDRIDAYFLKHTNRDWIKYIFLTMIYSFMLSVFPVSIYFAFFAKGNFIVPFAISLAIGFVVNIYETKRKSIVSKV